MRLEAVILPELGTGPDMPIVVSHWFAARGDEVWEGDRLVEVVVGPATFDVPAPSTGRLAEIRAARAIVRRGIDRGELPAGTSVTLLLDTLAGGAMMHALQMPADRRDELHRDVAEHAERLVDFLLGAS